MRYAKAEELLPIEVIHLIQEYVDGQSIYIPKKSQRLNWGTKTHIRQELAARDKKIYREFRKGTSTKDLATRYFLSTKSIQRIIRNEKEKCSESIF